MVVGVPGEVGRPVVKHVEVLRLHEKENVIIPPLRMEASRVNQKMLKKLKLIVINLAKVSCWGYHHCDCIAAVTFVVTFFKLPTHIFTASWELSCILNLGFNRFIKVDNWDEMGRDISNPENIIWENSSPMHTWASSNYNHNLFPADQICQTWLWAACVDWREAREWRSSGIEHSQR